MSDQNFDLLLDNATMMTPMGRLEGRVGVRKGKIAAIGDLSGAKAERVIDCAHVMVLPGIIDSQVHFREPGLEYKEDLEHGSRAAVLGGVTAVFEMPNTTPSTTTKAAIEDKLTRAQGRMHCDHAFYVGAAAENVDHLAELERLPGVCGVKLFMGASTGNLLVADDDTIEAVMRAGHRRMAIHAEDEPRLQARKALAREGDWSSHAECRDAESARLATERVLRLAKKTGRRVHVLHITTADEIDMLAAHKDVATFEILPQHLTLVAPDCYETLKGYAQMNPPIRSAEHQAGLWRAVQQGIVDVLGTDHAPHTTEEKQKPYPASPAGMPGVQTLVPVMLTHVAEGRLSLERMVDLLCHGQQRVFNIAGKGRLAVGYDADFTLVDLKAKKTITASALDYKCGWTPYEGFKATGWPTATIIRGQVVMQDGDLVNPGLGQPVRFQETLGASQPATARSPRPA